MALVAALVARVLVARMELTLDLHLAPSAHEACVAGAVWIGVLLLLEELTGGQGRFLGLVGIALV